MNRRSVVTDLFKDYDDCPGCNHSLADNHDASVGCLFAYSVQPDDVCMCVLNEDDVKFLRERWDRRNRLFRD